MSGGYCCERYAAIFFFLNLAAAYLKRPTFLWWWGKNKKIRTALHRLLVKKKYCSENYFTHLSADWISPRTRKSKTRKTILIP